MLPLPSLPVPLTKLLVLLVVVLVMQALLCSPLIVAVPMRPLLTFLGLTG